MCIEDDLRLGLEDLDAAAGGAGGSDVMYKVDGYSPWRNEHMDGIFGTYEKALKFCNKYKIDTSCISEWIPPHKR